MKTDKELEMMGLPEMCASNSRVTGETILIKRGESGYYKTDTQKTAPQINNKMGITLAQVSAMEAGSMFGWDCKGANPLRYDEKGNPIPA